MTTTDAQPTVTVILTPELRKTLGEHAESEDRSLGAVVRQALREYFEKHEERLR